MSDKVPLHVHNHDVVWLYDILTRIYTELAKSQSAPVSGMIVADQTRLETYIKNMRKAIEFINAVPELDLPESHPKVYVLEPLNDKVNVESEAINVLLRLVRVAVIEMVNSQSARLASRLIVHDAKRISTVVDKIEKFLTDYIRSETVPLDLPESSPEEPMITDGNMGVTGPTT